MTEPFGSSGCSASLPWGECRFEFQGPSSPLKNFLELKSGR